VRARTAVLAPDRCIVCAVLAVAEISLNQGLAAVAAGRAQVAGPLSFRLPG